MHRTSLTFAYSSSPQNDESFSSQLGDDPTFDNNNDPFDDQQGEESTSEQDDDEQDDLTFDDTNTARDLSKYCKTFNQYASSCTNWTGVPDQTEVFYNRGVDRFALKHVNKDNYVVLSTTRNDLITTSYRVLIGKTEAIVDEYERLEKSQRWELVDKRVIQPMLADGCKFVRVDGDEIKQMGKAELLQRVVAIMKRNLGKKKNDAKAALEEKAKKRKKKRKSRTAD